MGQKPVVRGAGARSFQVRARAINAGDCETEAREFEGVAADAAAQIENRLPAANADRPFSSLISTWSLANSSRSRWVAAFSKGVHPTVVSPGAI